jgi:hypothetical protein
MYIPGHETMYIPGHETTYLGKKLHTWVRNYTLWVEASSLDTILPKLPTRVQNFLPR